MAISTRLDFDKTKLCCTYEMAHFLCQSQFITMPGHGIANADDSELDRRRVCTGNRDTAVAAGCVSDHI